MYTDLDVTEAKKARSREAAAVILLCLVVVDSIQTVYEESVTSEPGSVNQIRECARRRAPC